MIEMPSAKDLAKYTEESRFDKEQFLLTLRSKLLARAKDGYDFYEMSLESLPQNTSDKFIQYLRDLNYEVELLPSNDIRISW